MMMDDDNLERILLETPLKEKNTVSFSEVINEIVRLLGSRPQDYNLACNLIRCETAGTQLYSPEDVERFHNTNSIPPVIYNAAIKTLKRIAKRVNAPVDEVRYSQKKIAPRPRKRKIKALPTQNETTPAAPQEDKTQDDADDLKVKKRRNLFLLKSEYARPAAPIENVSYFAFKAMLARLRREDARYTSLEKIGKKLERDGFCRKNDFIYIYQNEKDCPISMYRGLVSIVLENEPDNTDVEKIEIPQKYDASATYKTGQRIDIYEEKGVVVKKVHKNRIEVEMQNGECRTYIENDKVNPFFTRKNELF